MTHFKSTLLFFAILLGLAACQSDDSAYGTRLTPDGADAYDLGTLSDY